MCLSQWSVMYMCVRRVEWKVKFCQPSQRLLNSSLSIRNFFSAFDSLNERLDLCDQCAIDWFLTSSILSV